MTDYETRVREEIETTIDRAEFDTLDPAAIRVDITGSFRRKLGECRPLSPVNRDAETTAEYEIRIARRLFEDGREDRWRDTVRHEVAHAFVLEEVGSNVDPHGPEWTDAARRAGADPVARCEDEDLVDAAYVLACPNGCFERGYLQRSKRIKQPWQYTCDECGARPISYDVAERPADPDPGTCYVESIPWNEPRIVHACPNGCFNTGYGQHTEQTRQPERYRCEECNARTVAYPAGERPETLEPGTNYTE